MDAIQVFENENFGSIRIIEKNGEPWFVGKDVAEILGYSNTRDALSKRVDSEDKGVANCDTLGGKQELTIINESGLYSLVLSSKLSTAKQFKRWVTNEVLPTIRKHGGYLTNEKIEEVLLNPDTIIRLATDLKAERERTAALQSTVAVQAQQITELTPKASYYDVVLNCKDLLSVSKIAKDYGKSARWLNEKLHELGVQFKQGDIWLMYQKYAEMGYTNTKTHVVLDSYGSEHTKVHTYFTQKGRLFIYELLKNNGILPVAER